MSVFTPIQNGEQVTAARLNQAFDEISDAVLSSLGVFQQVTDFIALDGLNSYTINDIPTSIRVLKLSLLLRRVGSDAAYLRFNNDSTSGNYVHKLISNASVLSVTNDDKFVLTATQPAETAGELAHNDVTIFNTGSVRHCFSQQMLLSGGTLFLAEYVQKYIGANPITIMTIGMGGADTFATGSGFKLYALRG